MTFHDSLTGLPNRLLFQERLRDALAEATQYRRSLTVCYIDLVGFKAINDMLGHEAGGLVLQAIAARLNELTRRTDTVARMGGDEFAVVLQDMADGATLSWVVGKMLTRLREPVKTPAGSCRVTASIGICRYPEDANTVTALLACADEAMYRIKKQGKDGLQFWSDTVEPVSVSGPRI